MVTMSLFHYKFSLLIKIIIFIQIFVVLSRYYHNVTYITIQTTWYFKQYNNCEGKNFDQISNSSKTPKHRPNGRAMAVFHELLGVKVTKRYLVWALFMNCKQVKIIREIGPWNTWLFENKKQTPTIITKYI